MYCDGEPSRAHTSEATERLPPKYGKGESSIYSTLTLASPPMPIAVAPALPRSTQRPLM